MVWSQNSLCSIEIWQKAAAIISSSLGAICNPYRHENNVVEKISLEN